MTGDKMKKEPKHFTFSYDDIYNSMMRIKYKAPRVRTRIEPSYQVDASIVAERREGQLFVDVDAMPERYDYPRYKMKNGHKIHDSINGIIGPKTDYGYIMNDLQPGYKQVEDRLEDLEMKVQMYEEKGRKVFSNSIKSLSCSFTCGCIKKQKPKSWAHLIEEEKVPSNEIMR